MDTNLDNLEEGRPPLSVSSNQSLELEDLPNDKCSLLMGSCYYFDVDQRKSLINVLERRFILGLDGIYRFWMNLLASQTNKAFVGKACVILTSGNSFESGILCFLF